MVESLRRLKHVQYGALRHITIQRCSSFFFFLLRHVFTAEGKMCIVYIVTHNKINILLQSIRKKIYNKLIYKNPDSNQFQERGWNGLI